MYKIKSWLFATIVFWVATFDTNASVIYSNIRTNEQFTSGTWIVANLNYPEFFNHRVSSSSFIAAEGPNLELGSIIAPIFLSCYSPILPGPCATPPTGSTMSAWINIFQDNAGAPGAFLARSTAAVITPQTTISEFSFSLGTMLTPGVRYWIQADKSVSRLNGGWAANTQGNLGLGISLENFSGELDFTYFANSAAPAYTVLSSVPEPESWMLMLAAIPLAARLKKRCWTTSAEA